MAHSEQERPDLGAGLGGETKRGAVLGGLVAEIESGAPSISRPACGSLDGGLFVGASTSAWVTTRRPVIPAATSSPARIFPQRPIGVVKVATIRLLS